MSYDMLVKLLALSSRLRCHTTLNPNGQIDRGNAELWLEPNPFRAVPAFYIFHIPPHVAVDCYQRSLRLVRWMLSSSRSVLLLGRRLVHPGHLHSR